MALHLPGPAADGDAQPLAGINTTPLVDVMLVLLIIFLITVPVMRAPDRVALPRQAAAPRHARRDDVIISVTRGGRLYWGDTALSGLPALRRRLAAQRAAGAHARVQISADRAADFAAVNQVIEACDAAGIATLGFTTRAPQR